MIKSENDLRITLPFTYTSNGDTLSINVDNDKFIVHKDLAGAILDAPIEDETKVKIVGVNDLTDEIIDELIIDKFISTKPETKVVKYTKEGGGTYIFDIKDVSNSAFEF